LIPAIARLSDDTRFRADKVLILTSSVMRKNAEVLQQGLLFAGIQDFVIHDPQGMVSSLVAVGRNVGGRMNNK
jgi:hypothetical protein